MKTVLSLVALAGVAATSSAAVISSWNTAGLLGTEASLAPLAAPSGITSLNALRGSGVAGSAAANSMSATGWNDLSANDYFSFGFTVQSGYSVNLTDLSIGTRSSGTGPGTVGLFYSVDGYATALATISQAPGANFVNSILNLSSLTGLTGTVEFRIKAIGTTSANGGTTAAAGTFRITNYFGPADTGSFRFNGDVVPAPSAVALLGLGGLVAGRRRRA